MKNCPCREFFELKNSIWKSEIITGKKHARAAETLALAGAMHEEMAERSDENEAKTSQAVHSFYALSRDVLHSLSFSVMLSKSQVIRVSSGFRTEIIYGGAVERESRLLVGP